MARTSSVFSRVEPDLKNQAEAILEQLGISMSSAVEMFLRQVVIQRGIPFEIKLPAARPLFRDDLTKEEFDAEMNRAYESMKAGRMRSAKDVEEMMDKELGA